MYINDWLYSLSVLDLPHPEHQKLVQLLTMLKQDEALLTDFLAKSVEGIQNGLAFNRVRIDNMTNLLEGASTDIEFKGEADPSTKHSKEVSSQRNGLVLHADLLVERGNIEEAESNYSAALSFFGEALSIYEDVHSIRGIVIVHLKMAAVYKRQGHYEKAKIAYLKSHNLSGRYNFLLLQTDALTGLGEIQSALCKYESAIHYYEHSLTVSQKLGDQYREERILGNLGLVFKQFGQPDKAIDHYERALQISKDIGNKRRMGMHLVNLGNVFQDQGRFERAANFYEYGTRIAQEIGDKRGEGIHLGNLGRLYQNTGDFEKAVAAYKSSLSIARYIKDKRNEGITLGNIGSVYQSMGELDLAVEFLTQANVISSEIGNKRNASIHLCNLGTIFHFQKKLEKARVYFEESIKLSREIGFIRNEGIALGNLGNLLAELECWADSEVNLRQAVQFCIDTIPPAAGAFLGTLAWVNVQLEKPEEALKCLLQGEGLVEKMPVEHGKFLCKKAMVLWRLNQLSQSRLAIQTAEHLANKLCTVDDSELSRMVRETLNIIGS